MKKSKVIPRKFLPIRLPVNSTLLHFFLLIHFNVQDWIIGVYATLNIIVWILSVMSFFNEEGDENLINKEE